MQVVGSICAVHGTRFKKNVTHNIMKIELAVDSNN